MRVLLAGPDFEENLSIRYLASSLHAKRHETSLAVFNSADDVEAVAEQAGEAEIVGLSVWVDGDGDRTASLDGDAVEQAGGGPSPSGRAESLGGTERSCWV